MRHRTDMSTVLLVEDELLVRELASEDLGDAGFEVTAASDGDEALGYLREGRRFDLLFTDIRMPGATDGWQLAREARQLLPDIRVIYATGLGDAATAWPRASATCASPTASTTCARR